MFALGHFYVMLFIRKLIGRSHEHLSGRSNAGRQFSTTTTKSNGSKIIMHVRVASSDTSSDKLDPNLFSATYENHEISSENLPCERPILNRANAETPPTPLAPANTRGVRRTEDDGGREEEERKATTIWTTPPCAALAIPSAVGTLR